MKNILLKIALIIFASALVSAFGYMGELPDLNSADKPASGVDNRTQQKEKLPELMPAQDSNLYIQILGDKSKETAYLIDLRDLKDLLTNLKSDLNKKCSLQLFASYSSTYDLHVKYIIAKYHGKKEAKSSSYRSIIVLDNEILSIRKRWKSYEDNDRYIPLYFMRTKSKNEIAVQLNKLKKDINNTIYEITKK